MLSGALCSCGCVHNSTLDRDRLKTLYTRMGIHRRECDRRYRKTGISNLPKMRRIKDPSGPKFTGRTSQEVADPPRPNTFLFQIPFSRQSRTPRRESSFLGGCLLPRVAAYVLARDAQDRPESWKQGQPKEGQHP